MHESTIIQRALLTVYDKSHIIELAERLHLHGVELISTGNTAQVLKDHGLPVTPVGEYTGFPEMMDGRVKTLHPKIYGGILGRRDIDADDMIRHHIPDIDLVVVNLYPFQQVVNAPDHQLEKAIEYIDIGGPTLLRAAAKNFEWTSVLVDPEDYSKFIEELEKGHGAIGEKMRSYLATKAFAHTAAYDATIADYFSRTLTRPSATLSLKGEGVRGDASATLSLKGEGVRGDASDALSLKGTGIRGEYSLKETLRYGENPHQQATFYQNPTPVIDSITQAQVLQGKQLSFNNIVDGDTALECVKQFQQPSCVIVKHANPCGVASSNNIANAYDKAYQCDPTSAFGGIIAFNRSVDEKIIAHIFEQQFVEMIIAPEFTQAAKQLATEKPNCRLLQYQQSDQTQDRGMEIKSVNGGILVQTWDLVDALEMEVVSKRQPSKEEMQDLIFAWRVAKFVKSNAIVFARDQQTLGIGVGQMSRIFSTEIAALKAHAQQLNLKDAVMASDAFFPFKDNVEKAHQLGIRAIIQPGGSIKDPEVIQCANDLQIAMIFTKTRHFRH